MLPIDQESLKTIQPELKSGESVLWAGRPSTSVVFRNNGHPLLVPFSLLTGGFTILWEMGAIWRWISEPSHTVGSVFMVLCGIPFVVMGQYMVWGRFLHAAQKKKRTYYAVTNQRVIVVQNCGVQNCQDRQVAFAELNALPFLAKEKGPGEVDTLRFVPAPAPFRRTWLERVADLDEVWNALSIKPGPVFVDIQDVDSVHQLISALRANRTEAEVNRILHHR
jgi:hypothetical protein